MDVCNIGPLLLDASLHLTFWQPVVAAICHLKGLYFFKIFKKDIKNLVIQIKPKGTALYFLTTEPVLGMQFNGRNHLFSILTFFFHHNEKKEEKAKKKKKEKKGVYQCWVFRQLNMCFACSLLVAVVYCGHASHCLFGVHIFGSI